MTLSTLNSRIQYTGDGTTTLFPFPYYFLSDADLVVQCLTASTGVVTTKTLTTHYTVSGKGESSGGTVTMLSSPASGDTLTIYRDVSKLQDLSMEQNDPLDVTELEKRLDKAMMIDQRLSDRIDRSIVLDDADAGAVLKLPLKAARASQFLAFDANGIPITSPGASSVPVSPFWNPILQDSNAATAITDILGAGSNRKFLKWDSNQARHVRWADDTVFNVKDFGAAGDGIQDDTTFVINAITAAKAVAGTVFFPKGTYLISSSLVISDVVILRGEGMRYSKLKWTGGAGKVINVTSSTDNIEIHNLAFDNVGTATHAIFLSCIRALVSRVFMNPLVKFSTCMISTDPATTTYRVTLRNCELFSDSSSQLNPLGFYAAQGHSFIVDDCMFSGISTAIKAGIFGGNSATGVSIVNTRIELFSGQSTGYPGTANDIAIDVQNVVGLTIVGCNIELAGDQDASSTGHRAVRLYGVAGGFIGGNWMSANGRALAIINIANSTAAGVKIDGNRFPRYGGTPPAFAVEKTGTGSVWNNEIGANLISDFTQGSVFDNTFTPVLQIAGATTGITYTKQLGRAWRCGNVLYFKIQIVLSSKGALTGTVNVTGLPMVSENFNLGAYVGLFPAPLSVQADGLSSVSGSLMASVDQDSQSISLSYSGTGTKTSLSNANLANTSSLLIAGCYELKPVVVG